MGDTASEETAARILVVGEVARRPAAAGRLAEALAAALGEAPPLPAAELAAALAGGAAGGADAAVYAPSRAGGGPGADAAPALAALAAAPLARVVVLSSAEVYEPHHHNELLAGEDEVPARPRPNPVAARWRGLERAAAAAFAAAPGRLVVLRPAPVPLAGGEDFWSRLLTGRGPAPTLPGHDPTVQLLALDDLARAVRRALAGDAPAGTFHVVPAAAVPLRRALRLAGRRRLPVPRLAQQAARRLLPAAEPPERAAYLRYGWTVDGRRAAERLGFHAERTSAEAAAAAGGRPLPEPPPTADDFGYDPAYVAAFGRTLFRFLHDAYWRIEVRGLGNVPREGRAVLAGVHRGFMPWDGVMALHLLVRETGRPPRFLLHPTLLKFPFLFNYMTKLGGIPACRANADRILAADGLLAIFPEGIRGAFTPYRRAYRLGKFGRDEYVRMALVNRAPIVPFVTVGSAEIFPILARFEWSWTKRYLEWPFFPITPTFPLLPLPLPSKWHTRYLEPLHVEERYGPEAAEDPRVVRRIGLEVRRRMAGAIGEMLVRRRSIWYGSVFDPRPVALPGAPAVEAAGAPGDPGRE